MAKLSEHLTDRGLPILNRGLPTLNLDEVTREAIPADWDIDSVFGDILMCERVDENDAGEVYRNGIWLSQDITQNLWRVVKVIKKGPAASEYINEGDCLMIPGGRGISAVQKDKKKVIFINEDRIFARVIPRELGEAEGVTKK